MISGDENNRISDAIQELLENLSIEDAAAVLTVQLAVVIAQGSDDLSDARTFLNEVHQDALSHLENIDFDALDDDEPADGEPVTPTRN